MPSPVRITLAHVSDPHFSAHSLESSAGSSHSVRHLVEAEKLLKSAAYDRLIVSGDLSDRGDPESLNRAYEWLFNDIRVDADKRTGLRHRPEDVIVVPGNHDAYNCTESSGSVTEHWQKSIAHYNHLFNRHAFLDDDGCKYYWINKGDQAVFLVAVNSCHLNDPTLQAEPWLRAQTISRISKIARGKLTIAQSKRMMKWFDNGHAGKLRRWPDSTGDDVDERIPAADFARSFKVLVMHHYLFEPAGYQADPFLQLSQKKVAFRNIAMADFDVLLCGHKHVPEATALNYGSYFVDHRSRGRYTLNLFRRLLGLNQLPLDDDSEARRMSRVFRDILTFLYTRRPRTRDESAEEYSHKLVEALRNVLAEPKAWRKHFGDFIGTTATESVRLSSAELEDIMIRIQEDLSREEKSRLETVLREIRRVLANLGSRPFVQFMAGSSAKAVGTSGKTRAFNFYDIDLSDGDAVVSLREFIWRPGSNTFAEGSPQQFIFPRHRRMGGA